MARAELLSLSSQFSDKCLQIFFQLLCFINLLPRKGKIISPEMSVSRCLFINRASKIKHLDNSCRTEIKILSHNLNQLLIGEPACAEGIYHDRSRVCNTDCIRKLNLAFLSKSGCNNIFCRITGRICRGPVYLRAVLA